MIDLFNKNFFKLALGFIAIILVSMTVITLGHLLGTSGVSTKAAPAPTASVTQ
jgi:hypothetical protein